MKEFIEKLISRLEERSKEYNSGVRLHGKPEEMLTNEAIEIVNQLAEEYKTSFMQELVEARRNCSEDSDCSECPFGQIEDRCILAELQTDADNNGWISCSERLPEVDKDVLVCFSNDMDFVIAYHTRMIETNYEDVWINSSTANRITSNVIAWQPLPEPYQPKGE